MCFTHSFFHFATLRKSLQTTSASPCPYVWLLTLSVSSTTSKQYFELTSLAPSTTSKQCFEQPAASFLVCSLIFIEY
ncbi:S1 RNA-binding domain-containing protein [Streptococcus pneumoniae]|nr:S1 RNA-binding domain-containing protein [Streptococcus pneumoniae]